MPRHDRDGFCRIERAATAEADDAVMAIRLERGEAGVDDFIGRVGDYAVEDPALDVPLGQTIAYPAGDSMPHHGLVGDDQRTAYASDPCKDVRHLIKTALADLQEAWDTDPYRFPHSPSRFRSDGLQSTAPVSP